MRLWLIPALLLLTAPALAQSSQPQAISERLLMTPPAGWQALPQENSGRVITTRFLPPNQTAADWNQMLLVQIYPGPGGNGREYIDQVISTSRSACEVATPGTMVEGEANGYALASVTISCTRGLKSGQGGLMLLQTLRGEQAFYVIQRMWRGQPFQNGQPLPVPKSMVEEWRAFARTVSLCDRSNAKHPCP